jgi:predicted AAA+ superfamily ATPase
MNKDKKEIIKKILLDFEPEKISLVRRDLSIPFNSSLIISLIGPRKAGKTYFLYQIIQDLLKKGLKKEQIVYINFEDERLLPLTKDDADLVLEAYFELYPSFDKKIFFFFDEIQNLPFWPNFLRRISQKHFNFYHRQFLKNAFL